ncbi:MAG: NADH-quinone oxidoreductase subunit [Actinomycetota bacterium]|nr:NADH-quinone oxidoreductase subunit [Actinomycetota bacterium]
MDADASAEERASIDAYLGPPQDGWDGGAREGDTYRVGRSGQAARDQRELLIEALHVLQGDVGWISPGGMNYVCRRLSVPPADAFGVASFYAMFATKERPKTAVHVCDDLACRVLGAKSLLAELEAAVGPEGTAASDGSWTWHRSPCLGMCEQAPAILAQRAGRPDVAVGGATAADVVAVAAEGSTMTSKGAVTAPQTRDTTDRADLRLLRRVGHVDPASIDDYRANGGYEGLHRALEIGPEATIAEVKDAKLMGRGGAAFPTGVKWEAVATQPAHPHYYVCNADESEPGTFKDRLIMELDPFAVVESLTIAGVTTGCAKGYIYIRGEYPLATERLAGALGEARRHGLLGTDIMGRGAVFDIELRRGAGAYICGEETALLNSIEGKRGEPRNKPPFPVQRGLFGKPTGINNVETLINVLEVLRIGGAAYAAIGSEGSTGPRLFCLSGQVARPGVYEVEHGATLGEVIELAGGPTNGIKAVLLGGAAGGFVGPDRLDVRLTFEDARAGGYTLGSGVVMVLGEDTDLVDLILRIARFFRDESCGQCVPCRVGTVRQEEAIHRMVAGRTVGSVHDELVLLDDIAKVMRDASICGLGQTAASAVQSAIATFGLFGSGGVA